MNVCVLGHKSSVRVATVLSTANIALNPNGAHLYVFTIINNLQNNAVDLQFGLSTHYCSTKFCDTIGSAENKT